MFPPIFPVTISALAPLNRYAPAIWLAGVFCLWLTRYTHQLGKRWGRGYYILSAGVRPLGVLLIAVGWLALYTPGRFPYMGLPPGPGVLWLPHGNATDVLCWLALLGFSALGLWAVATLGLRQSFLYRSLDDRLITHGPYALVRHPQFLSAIGMAVSGAALFDPGSLTYFTVAFAYYHSPLVNAALLALALWVLAVLEDRELASHFGAEYEAYAARVRRIFPN
jgi:protein-S-isoprenylcysteine O-methyltransferase Ste14